MPLASFARYLQLCRDSHARRSASAPWLPSSRNTSKRARPLSTCPLTSSPNCSGAASSAAPAGRPGRGGRRGRPRRGARSDREAGQGAAADAHGRHLPHGGIQGKRGAGRLPGSERQAAGLRGARHADGAAGLSLHLRARAGPGGSAGGRSAGADPAPGGGPRRARGGDDERLVSTPLMVRLLLIVHYNERRLPDQRADLFDRAVNALVQVDYAREEQVRQAVAKDWKRHRDMAQALAFRLHSQGSDQGREMGEAKLVEFLSQEADHKPHLDGFLTQARTRGGLLEERNGVYRFIHLAFQEFLVARHLREVIGAAGVNRSVAFLADGKLADPALVARAGVAAGGLLGRRAERPRAASWCAGWVVAGRACRRPRRRVRRGGAGRVAALEWRDCPRDCAPSWRGASPELFGDRDQCIAAPPAVRARAGRALSELGDPAKGVSLTLTPAPLPEGEGRLSPTSTGCRSPTTASSSTARARRGASCGCRHTRSAATRSPTPSSRPSSTPKMASTIRAGGKACRRARITAASQASNRFHTPTTRARG